MQDPVRGGTGRRGDIQGLRAVAVLLVVLFHAGLPVPGGFVGVDVFFVISGYVITRMLREELVRSDRIDLRKFYLRRIRRILPALALLLVLTLVASVLLAPIGGQTVTARTGAAASLFSANIYLMRTNVGYFDVGSNVNALLHTWSLSVEEQFYLVFPAVLLGAWLLTRRRFARVRDHALVAVLGAIVVVSFVVSWVLTDHAGVLHWSAVDAQKYAFYSAPTRAWEFALGGLVALFAASFARLRPGPSLLFALVGVAGIAWAALALDEQSPFPGLVAVIPVVGAALLIAAGERADGNPVNRALAVGPAQHVGGVSYSWYLWHWPMIVFAAALWPGSDAVLVVAAAASFAPAVLSRRFVEDPIRFRPRPPTRRTLALALACIVVPLVAAGALLAANRVVLRNHTVRALDHTLRFHADVRRGCDVVTPLGARDLPQCEWRVDAPVGGAVLIGDSNAGQFTEAFTAGFNAAGWDAVVATSSSCPFADLTLVWKGLVQKACRHFVSESMRTFVETRPDVVVIASASDLYIEEPEFDFVLPDGTRATTVDEKRAAWERGTKATIDTLERNGTHVVLAHPVPKFVGWDPRECATVRRLFDDASCAASRSTRALRRFRATAVAAEGAAVTGTSAETLDVFDELCPESKCSMVQSGRWRWRDGQHITVDASRRLAGVFAGIADRVSPG